MSPTAGGSQARKRRGTTTGKNRGKGDQTRPRDDQQAAWDEALAAMAALPKKKPDRPTR